MTNKGLRITVPLTADVDYPGNWIVYLDCYQLKGHQQCAVGILLKELSEGGDQFARVAQATLDIPMSLEHEATAEKRAIYIRKEIIRPDDAFKGDIHRPREFRLLQTPSTHQLVEKYGSAREGSNSQKLLAPPKINSYWIDRHAWFNWHVICLFEEKESVYRAQTSSFIIVLGYDGNAGEAWCAVEPFNHQSLRDVWDEPAVGDPGAVEVYVHFNYGLGDSSDPGTSRDMDPLSIFSGADDVADICIHLVKHLEDTGVAISAFGIDLSKDAQSGLAVHESTFLAIDKSIRGFIKDLKALGAANKSI
ncbi:hypothetical protein G7Y89_g15150 [Cudoniella acicularis]|uniref:Uncharacterized protein n=1 Tax=Cudoniella acicularis TaxID=354080 RepID=A0A8H4VNL7_9HELO|nr:hypothetical protein G7Y89_g15150 [Cudoniella acicularis]